MGRRDQSGGSSAGSGERERNPKPPSRWEWVIGGLSALLVLGILGFMMYDALATPASPPRLVVQVDSLHAADRGGGYLVEFRIRNHGRSTAASVLVEGELAGDTGTVEKAQVTVDYVPGRSERLAGLVFSNDPRRHSLRIHPKGYDTP